jgi:hypothetical protein
VEGPRAAGAGLVLHIHHGLDARQVGGQRAPVRPPLGDPSRLLARPALFRFGVLSGFGLLGLFEREQQLIFGQALGAAPEAMALKSLDDETQPLTFGTLL